MKKYKILFWTSTIFIFLFEGVMPALTGNSEMALEGFRHLGYPDYFAAILVFYKVMGSIILIIPRIPARLKEWAYAGFTFDFISASASYFVVDGFGFFAIFPLIILAILAISYFCFHKLLKAKNISVDDKSLQTL